MLPTFGAHANGYTSLYMGAGGGEIAQQGFTDTGETTIKLLLGINASVIPLLDFGVETTFYHADATRGVALSALAGVGLPGPVNAFAKAGVSRWSKLPFEGADHSSDKALMGIGLRSRLLGVTVQGDIERVEATPDNSMTFTTVSVSYTFQE